MLHTRDYYATQGERLNRLIRILGLVVAGIAAVGAVFGALNTMYAAVSTRAREIATLRAIGFSGAPVVVSVMLESALLALAGGVIGAAVAWSAVQQLHRVDPGAELQPGGVRLSRLARAGAAGTEVGLAIGLIGGLFPAVRAARLPVTTALRAE